MDKKMIILVCIPFLVGCDAAVTDYVSGVKPKSGTGTNIDSPITQTDSDRAFKVSPGQTSAAGSYYRAALTVTPTKQSVAGSHYRAELSINQQRQ